MVAAGAGPVPRDSHAHVGIPAVLAGRPHADGAFGGRPLSVPRSSGGRGCRITACRVQATRPRRKARAQARGTIVRPALGAPTSEATVPGAGRAVLRMPRSVRLDRRSG